jgi:LPXTG-motif cell wall-anchored protein
MKKIIAPAMGVGLVLASLATTPAFAVAALPSTDTYIALPCSDAGDPVANLNAIASDGTSTGIGGTVYSGGNCFADGSYNIVDGTYYAWDRTTNTFFSVDVTTGALTEVGNGDISVDGSSVTGVNGIFVSQTGDFYMFTNSTPANLYSLSLGATVSDPTIATLVGALPTRTSAMAYNPVTGKIYAQEPKGAGQLSEVSLTDASVLDTYTSNCNTNEWGFGSGDCWGLDFDSNGTLWYQTDDGDLNGASMLASATLPASDGDSFELVSQGAFTDPTTGSWSGLSTGIVFSTPSPELPDTGVSSAGAVLGSITALLLVAGGIVLMRRRRT